MTSLAERQYRMIHDIYVLLDDGDRRLLRGFDLSMSQYAALFVLDDADGLRLTDISERLLLDKSTVTRIIDRLEGLALVRRLVDPGDRRAQRAILTPRGAALRETVTQEHERSLSQRLSALSSEEQQQLRALLDKLRNGLHAELRARASAGAIQSG